jgi:hypothetical protein
VLGEKSVPHPRGVAGGGGYPGGRNQEDKKLAVKCVLLIKILFSALKKLYIIELNKRKQ